MIRPWFIYIGQATDRRMVEENFLALARRLSMMTSDAIPRGVLTRDLFAAYAIEEYWYAESPNGGMSYLSPEYGQVVPEIDLVVPTAEFLNFEIGWSIQAAGAGDDAILLAGWPVVGGQAIWAAESHVQFAAEEEYASGVTDPENTIQSTFPAAAEDQIIPLGCVAYGQAAAGRNPVGIILAGIGHWRISKAQVLLRAIRR